MVPMASLRQEDSKDGVCSMRRAILFVGISVLPLLQLRATALEGLATSKLNCHCDSNWFLSSWWVGLEIMKLLGNGKFSL